jgi:hypothetical protein
VNQAGGFGLGAIRESEPGTNGAGDDDTFPVYYANNYKDPTYKITCNEPYGTCPFPSPVPIPPNATASIDSDHHLTVIDSADKQEWDFWEVNDSASCPGSGCGNNNPITCEVDPCTLNIGWGNICNQDAYAGKGVCNGSAVAAGVAVQPGLLDGNDLVLGIVDHTIYVAIACAGDTYYWPANKPQYGGCSDAPSYGEKIWLSLTTAQIQSLVTAGSIPQWEEPLLIAMHDYGLMIVDEAGVAPGDPWIYYGEGDATWTLWGLTPGWTNFFNACNCNPEYSDNSSHLQLITTGITQADIQVVP